MNVIAPPAVRCAAVAHAVRRVPVAEVAPLRQQPHPTLSQMLPANLLKHADEQTVVGLVAVLQAVTDFGLDPQGFADWGVLGAPRFMGRAAMAQALQKFAQEGAWGISPHLIPHRSLHALSGTVSQALRIHGPNIGVGGGPFAVAEGLVAAAALFARERLPGVWLLLTGTEHEAVFTHQPVCVAVALALVAEGPGPWELEIDSTATAAGCAAPLTLEALAAALADDEPSTAASWRLACGGRLRLQRNAGCEEKHK